jgi:EAL domain-containing protein (putative c-di-GMP-specific phosphodiesterase class I)/ActR/RegA family two-component response regulator
MKTRLGPGRWEVIVMITACLLVWAAAWGLHVTNRVEAALPNPVDDAVATLATAAALIGLRRWRQASRTTQHLSDIHEELARQAEAERVVLAEHQERIARLVAIIETGIEIALQPIRDLRSDRVAGYEALARFADGQGPTEWFAEAEALGVGMELELAALRAALVWLAWIPPSCYLSVNLSPATLLSGGLLAELRGINGERVVLELTEHVGVSEYAPARAALAKLRPRGFRLAVDDAGAGHSSLRHILELSPEIIKLDRELIHDIHADVARSTLGNALVGFANSIGSVIVAEGIEVEGELRTAVDIGVQYGQGYLLARPSPAPLVVESFSADAAGAPPRGAHLRSVESLGAMVRGGALRVVIADDSSDLRLFVRSVLELDGRFTVVAEAGDGVAAVRAAAEHRPEVIVLDTEMPVMGGLDALPLIRDASPSTKVLILTASGASQATAVRAGAHAYHHKAGPLFWLPDALARLVAEHDAAEPGC